MKNRKRVRQRHCRVLATALFDVVEAQKIIEGEARITVLPQKCELLNDILASAPAPAPPPAAARGRSQVKIVQT